MAIYHASLKVHSRGKGASSVAAAAYRAGARFHDHRTAMTHSYLAKKGVEQVVMLAPADAPDWASDPEQMWNQAEAAERRSNATVARELIVALPDELSAEQRFDLARAIAHELVQRYAVGTMLAMHAPDSGGDQRNHHAHVLFTTRMLGAVGFGSKVRVLDDRKTGPQEVLWLREKVANLTNQALAAAGIEERVNHRTLQAQADEAEAAGDFDKAARLTREPTKHQGRAATAAYRRGEFVPVVAENQRKRRHHDDALAAYLRQAHAEGRLMPATHDLRPPRQPPSALRASPEPRPLPTLPWRPDPHVRATGPGAAALNAQAAVQADQTRRSKKAADDYLRGVEATAREAKRWLDEYAELAGRQHAMEAWLEGTDDAEALRLMQKSVETLRELRRADVARRASTKNAAMAQRARRTYQQAMDAHDAKKPSRWALMKSRDWEKVRRAKWAALRKALAEEQTARVSQEDDLMTYRQKSQELRSDLRKFEQELRDRKALPKCPNNAPVRVSQNDAAPRARPPRP